MREARNPCLRRRPVPGVVLLAAWLLAGLVLGAADESSAQSGSKAGDAKASEGSVSKAIPVGDVPARAQDIEVFLLEIENRAKSDPRVEAIAEELPALSKSIRERAAHDTKRLSEEGQHRAALETVLSDWRDRQVKLDLWYEILSSRSTGLAKDVERLSERRARWAATREETASEALSKVLVERIGATLRQIAEERRRVDGRLAQVLDLQDEVVRLKRTVESLLGDVEEARNRAREELLSLEQVPIWKLQRHDDGALLAAVTNTLQRELVRIREFASMRVDDLAWFGVFGLVLMILFRLLGHSQRRRLTGDESLAGVAHVLSRPISGAAVIWLLSLIFVFPTAPLLMTGIAALLLVVPVLRLVPYALLPDVRWVVYGLSAWFAVATIRLNLIPEPMLSRFLLLGESSVVLLISSWLLRPARLSLVGEASSTLRTIALGLRLLVPMVFLSIIANIFGLVGLAELLVEGSLVTLYAAFVLYVVLQVLDAAWAATLQTRTAGLLRIVQRHESLLRQRGHWIFRVGLHLLWLHIVLNAFRIREWVYGALWDFLTAELLVGELQLSPGDFVLAGLMVWLSFLISRFVRFVLEEDVLSRAALPRGVPFAVSTIVRYVILLIGFMLAVAAAGMDTSRFALMVGALGVGIGIGLQDVVNNFVSGLILLFERPIQQGDTVEVSGLRGDIKRIGLRSSTLRTFEGAEVIIPNSGFVSSQFINWTLSDRQRRISLPVGVAYGSDPERVIELLVAVAEAHPDILSDPEVVALFTGFGDSSLDFELRAWTLKFESWRQVQSDLGVEVIRALREAGITIPFPQRDLHLRSVSPDLGESGSARSGVVAETGPLTRPEDPVE